MAQGQVGTSRDKRDLSHPGKVGTFGTNVGVYTPKGYTPFVPVFHPAHLTLRSGVLGCVAWRAA